MKIQRLLIGLTLINLALLVSALTQIGPGAAVLLRLITERGRPAAKISSSEEAAAVGLAGPTNTKDTYVILEAKGSASSLRLRNEDGREQIVKP